MTNNKWSWELGKRSRGDWHVLGRKGREGKTRTSNSRKLGWKKMNAHCLHLGTMWSNWTVWVSFCFCRFFLEDHQPIRCPYRIPILDPGPFLSLLQTWVHRLLRRNTTSWPQFNSLQWNRCHWHLTRKTGDWRLETGDWHDWLIPSALCWFPCAALRTIGMKDIAIDKASMCLAISQPNYLTTLRNVSREREAQRIPHIPRYKTTISFSSMF